MNEWCEAISERFHSITKELSILWTACALSFGSFSLDERLAIEVIQNHSIRRELTYP
ncbi:MAG: hypothetical protein IPL98_10635 [Saprospiraceae bacterium]|nr:hypothetical protein [Saprospiraceae bacterium]